MSDNSKYSFGESELDRINRKQAECPHEETETLHAPGGKYRVKCLSCSATLFSETNDPNNETKEYQQTII